jgi:DedD protein
MRDTHRMKEKYDLSLDGRQVGGLFVGGIVVLGAVFVLGVVVGKKLATDDSARAAPDLLAALDQRAQTPLTFQEELTRQRPVAPPTPDPQPAVPVPAAVPAAAVKPPEPPAPVPAPAAPPAAAALLQTEDAEAAPEAPASPSDLKAAFARVAEPPPQAAPPSGVWTLQLSASQNKDEADRFVLRLRDRGYAPFVVRAEVPDKGTWYRVRLGSFPSREAAHTYLQDFKRETQLDAFVAANN